MASLAKFTRKILLATVRSLAPKERFPLYQVIISKVV
jgi:hypothetical protein